MTVLEIQSDFNLEAGSLPRSPGLHVSEIIRDVALTMGYLSRDDEEELDWTLNRYRLAHGENMVKVYPAALYRVALGLSWEEWLGRQRPDIHFHGLGELWRDGIVGTPDGLSFTDSGAGIIHEIKLTWKSSRSDREAPSERIHKEFMWCCQTKSYLQLARVAGGDFTTAQLHVYWVNGNYRGSGPEYRTYQLTFTTQELDANWRLLTNAGRKLQEFTDADRTDADRTN